MTTLWSMHHQHVGAAHARLKLLGTSAPAMLERELGPELVRAVEAAKRACGQAELVLFRTYVAERDGPSPEPDYDAMLEGVAETLTSGGLHDTARHVQHVRKLLRGDIELRDAAREARRARAA
ncbi:MAG: hypothetical protein JNM26_04160 [Ideonella sp.]|nr:hypothetical protein [Ideonella sp.]